MIKLQDDTHQNNLNYFHGQIYHDQSNLEWEYILSKNKN